MRQAPRIQSIPSASTMKDLIWDNTLSVDVPEIDADHRKLVDLFNLLNHAVAEGEAKAYVEAVMEELVSCTVWHFRHEERLMLKYGYAGFAEHKSEHEALIESAKMLQQQFLRQGESSALRAPFQVRISSIWSTG
jgi:hemerythrin